MEKRGAHKLLCEGVHYMCTAFSLMIIQYIIKKSGHTQHNFKLNSSEQEQIYLNRKRKFDKTKTIMYTASATIPTVMKKNIHVHR